jgi:hypothetical protein
MGTLYLLKQQTLITVFRLQKNNGSLPFLFAINKWKLPFSIYIRVYIEMAAYIYIYIYICICIYICCHFKWRMEAQVIFLNPFKICSSANKSLSSVRLFQRNKQKLSVCKWIKWIKWIKWTKRTCPFMFNTNN